MNVSRIVVVSVTLCCFFILLRVYSASGSSWAERKNSHKTRTLRDDKLKQIAEMCDNQKRTVYFRDSLLKPMLIERVSGTEGNRIVREHIKHILSDLGWEVEEDSFIDKTPYGEKTFVNIMARQNPSATRHLTLACHYDSKLMSNMQFIGATDSAVPCAILLDIAGLLSSSLSRGHHSDLTLQLLFFDGEEAFVEWTETDSLYGARHLANKMANIQVEVERELLVTQLETIDTLVLLDLIGTEETQFANWFSKTLPLYKTFRKIESRLAASGLLDAPSRKKQYFTSSEMQFYENRGGGIQDDHIPFHRKGVPIIHLISNPFPSVWHKASDNEEALHYPTIDDIRKIMVTFVVEYMHLTHLNE